MNIIKNIIFILAFTNSSFSIAKELANEDISQAYYKSYNYEKSGNYLDAIRALQLVYSKYSKTYGVNNRLGYLYRLNKQFKNATFHYKQAIQALPDSLTPKLGLMFSYIQAQNYKDSSKIGFQIISIDYYNYYGNLRLAYTLRQTKEYEMAEKVAIKMLTRYPSDVLYLTEFGLLKFNQKKTERAAAIMREVLILDPENVSARFVLQSLEK